VGFTAGLLDAPQWRSCGSSCGTRPAGGLTDVSDAQTTARLRDAGYAALYPKPVVADEVAAAARRLLERRRLAELSGLYGESEAIRQVLVQIEQYAPVSSTVLIEGESGTGKELVARGIHRCRRGARARSSP
jgi:DNA-binding NtrC family response regulator